MRERTEEHNEGRQVGQRKEGKIKETESKFGNEETEMKINKGECKERLYMGL